MIVFLLRHADRKPPADALSPAGVIRANLLARMLAESGIRTAYCSDAARAKQTLRPLQDALGAKLNVVTEAEAPPIVDGLKTLPDTAVAVVIGHSDTIGPIIEGLTGQTIDEIAEHQFDKLFIVSRPATGAATVALTRYGEPSKKPVG